MSCATVQQDDAITLRLTIVDCHGVAVDVSSANTSAKRQLVVISPSGADSAIDLSFVTTGVDGRLAGTFAAAALGEVGRWQYQAWITFGTGEPFKSRVGRFDVIANLVASL